MNGDVQRFLSSQIERALAETREALGHLASGMKLAGSCTCLIPILDKYEFEIRELDDESSFKLNEEGLMITISAEPVLRVWNEMYDLATAVGLEGGDRLRAQETAVNQFVIHELFHVNQRLWDFSAVPAVKAGLPTIGLAILDLAADIESAWVCAQVESYMTGQTGNEILKQFVDALLRAYMIGAFVFDARSPAKRQRAIGLVISLVVVQAKIDGRLNLSQMNRKWTPVAPILAFDLGASQRFNAIILSDHIGLLIPDHDVFDGDLLNELWDCVGKHPIERMIELVSMFLKASGAIL